VTPDAVSVLPPPMMIPVAAPALLMVIELATALAISTVMVWPLAITTALHEVGTKPRFHTLEFDQFPDWVVVMVAQVTRNSSWCCC